MKANIKEISSGGIFVLAGLFYGALTLSHLRIGEALNMGPGYFPIVLSGMLVVMGALIAIRGLTTSQGRPFGKVAWRGAILITIAIVVFTLALDRIGLLPTTVLTAFIACFSSTEMRPLKAVIISIGIGLFCTGIFGYVIRLPVPIFGPIFAKLFG